MARTKSKARRHVEEYFVEVDPSDVASTITSDCMQGTIDFTGYKGAVIMSIESAGGCPCHRQRTSAWLYDDDFDKLISALRKAKRGWKKADNKGAREKRARGAARTYIARNRLHNVCFSCAE